MTWTSVDVGFQQSAEMGFGTILIEAPIGQARTIFEHHFRKSAYQQICDCCGEDFTFEQLAEFPKLHPQSTAKIMPIPEGGWDLSIYRPVPEFWTGIND